MQFGIFDHIDRNDRPLTVQLDERIRYVALAEELGFYCYHVAEHHAAPIKMVPVPGLFLAAAARATMRIRLGPLDRLVLVRQHAGAGCAAFVAAFAREVMPAFQK